nr:ATP synthase F0 subunit 8 [Ligia exotica]
MAPLPWVSLLAVSVCILLGLVGFIYFSNVGDVSASSTKYKVTMPFNWKW